jgi:3,4-dihydroxy 2-butanone 4-phosphate synthase/GTP cyclohydrolase II
MVNKLRAWLEANKKPRNAFAKAINVSPAYVTLLCSDTPAWPGRKVAARIRKETKGAVTANDFLPPARASELQAEAAE